MKIAHFYVGLGRHSDGASIAALNLAKSQKELGHEISLFSWREPADSPEEEIVALSRYWKHQFFWFSNLDSIKELLQNQDVLHVHAGYYSFPTALVALLARWVRLPYVYSPHGALTFLWCRPESWKQNLYGRAIGRQMLNHAKWVHVFSENEAELLRSYGVKSRLVTIPNGIDLSRVPDHGLKQKIRNVKTQDLKIGFLGRLDIWKKGLDNLVRAVPIMCSYHDFSPRLLIAGPDWYGQKKQLEELSLELGVSDRINFWGEVNTSAVFEFFSQIDLLAIPSRYEGFPLVFLEACAAGCPVIVSSGSNISEIVETRGVGLIASSPIQLAEAVKYIADNPAIKEKMAQNARRLADSLTWLEIAARTTSVY